MTEEPIAEKKPPFYKQVTVPESTVKQVSDPGAAKELAGIEAQQGRDAALGREAELKREHETGLTDEERANIELMDGLKENYPDAFVDTLDDKNRRLLILKRGKQGFDARKEDPVYTQLGHFSVQVPGSAENYNLTKVLDLFLPEGRSVDTFSLQSKSTDSAVGVKLIRIDLSDAKKRSLLKSWHKQEQETQVKIAQAQKAQEKQLTPKELIAEL